QILIKDLEEQYPEDFRVNTAKADFLTKTEQYEEALKTYELVLEKQKGNYYIWEQTIFIENILEKHQAVYDRCDEALSYFNDKPLLYLLKGNSAMQLNKNKEAIRILDKGLGLAKNNIPLTVQFYSFLAEAWRNEKNYEKSDSYFEQALQMEPDNMLILNNYGYYLSIRGEKLDAAEKMSRKTIEAEPENSTYLDTYAWILFKSGDIEKARDYMEKAIQYGGANDPDILEHYGDILMELGQKKEAKKYWTKAIDAGSTSEEIKSKLDD
ncbi:MAG: tetratricopeptide repeat protein, partial [Candidatus Heimdallarchaeota archaeon]|nr:tetratricopeptide repeat protein [Candidatus Heimdallarchaeota archaeon]